MPPGAVQRQYGKGTRGDPPANFLQMPVHRVDIGVRQHEPSAHPACWANGAEQIGPFVTLIAQRRGAAATLGPNAGQTALLTNTGFVLPPQLDRPAVRGRGDGGSNQFGKVFLCASCGAASA